MQIIFGLRIYKIFLSFSLQEVLNPFLEMEKILLKQYNKRNIILQLIKSFQFWCKGSDSSWKEELKNIL